MPMIVSKVGRFLFGGPPKAMVIKAFFWLAVVGGLIDVLNQVQIAEPTIVCDEASQYTLTIRGLRGTDFFSRPPEIEIEKGCGVIPEKEIVLSPLAFHYVFSLDTSQIKKEACDVDITIKNPIYKTSKFQYLDGIRLRAE